MAAASRRRSALTIRQLMLGALRLLKLLRRTIITARAVIGVDPLRRNSSQHRQVLGAQYAQPKQQEAGLLAVRGVVTIAISALQR